MPACRSRIGFICRRNGPKTQLVARRRVFPRQSPSRLNRRSRLSRSAQLTPRACRAVSCCWMRVTAPTPRCALASVPWSSTTVDKNISFRALVDLAKMRWRIERDYQELKQEIGLGHYEGRGWPGFHHHGTLCIAAYGFLLSERETIPPSGPRSSRRLTKPAIPARYRPRGSF